MPPKYVSRAIPELFEGDTFVSLLRSSAINPYYPCEDYVTREYLPFTANEIGRVNFRQSKSNEPVDVAAVGDSQAEHLFSGLIEASPNKNVASYSMTGTLPIQFDADTSRMLEYVGSTPFIQAVIVDANWAGYGDLPQTELIQTLRIMSEAEKSFYHLLSAWIPSTLNSIIFEHSAIVSWEFLS